MIQTNDVLITANDLTAMVVDTKLSQIAMYKDPAARPPLIYQPSVLAALLGMRWRCGWRSVRSQAGAGCRALELETGTRKNVSTGARREHNVK